MKDGNKSTAISQVTDAKWHSTYDIIVSLQNGCVVKISYKNFDEREPADEFVTVLFDSQFNPVKAIAILNSDLVLAACESGEVL